jgi:hypothetical protein
MKIVVNIITAFCFSALPEYFRCNLCWKNSTTLLVGWVDTVRVCVIRKRILAELSNRELPEFVVETGGAFETTQFDENLNACGLTLVVSNTMRWAYDAFLSSLDR